MFVTYAGTRTEISAADQRALQALMRRRLRSAKMPEVKKDDLVALLSKRLRERAEFWRVFDRRWVVASHAVTKLLAQWKREGLISNGGTRGWWRWNGA